MKSSFLFLYFFIVFCNVSCHNQINKNMQEQKNALLCDPEIGLCINPMDTLKNETSTTVESIAKPIKIIYYTDPICSSCWGIEAQLRKLKLEYGKHFEIEYKMGGLLPDWSYNSGGISKPSDVAHHWDEVSVYYDMPIDGDIWLEDPLPSSYPPSIAFKAAQLQDEKKAILFLREIREMVFLKKKNIAKWEQIEVAAKLVELNVVQLKTDYEGIAKEIFNADLQKGKELGVRGFPCLFFMNQTGEREIVYGTKPYDAYENAIKKLLPSVIKEQYSKDWNAVFSTYNSLTAKEFSVLTETNRNEAEKVLNELTSQNKLNKFNTKNGAIWTLSKQ